MSRESPLGQRKRKIALDHEDWILDHPDGTLAELKQRFESAVEQCRQIIDSQGDRPVEDVEDIPEPLATELDYWDNSGQECTMSRRQVNLEECLREIDDLVGELGPDFRAADLSAEE